MTAPRRGALLRAGAVAVTLGAMVAGGLCLRVPFGARGASRESDRPERASYRSPCDVSFSSDGATLAVSDATAGVLYVIDAAGGRVARQVRLRGRPTGVVWSAPARVLVGEYDAGTVAEVDVASGAIVRRLKVGPKPVGLAVAPKSGLLVVCEYGLNYVSILDLKSGRHRARVPAGYGPRAVAITPDERLAVVGNLLPAGASSDPKSAAAVHLIDLAAGKNVAEIDLLPGSSNVREVAVSPDGKWAYAVHTLGRVVLPTTQLDRGWVNTNALSIIDLAKRRRYATVLLDYVTQGAADPWGLAVSPDARAVWISLAGAGQVARIELASLHAFLSGQPDRNLGSHDRYSGSAAEIWAKLRDGEIGRDVLSYDLGALYGAGLISRHDLPVRGPRGLDVAPDGKTLAVAGYYGGQVLLLDPQTCKTARTVDLGPQPDIDQARRGEMLFHDGTRSFQRWLSCATCHPHGRADGLNWDLLNDGIGNPKNTRSMLLSDRTPPVMSRGVRAHYGIAVDAGFRYIEFHQPGEGEVEAVKAYIRSLKAEPSPYLIDGQLSAKAREGKKIFESARTSCATCHPGPLFTDLKIYDVGTRGSLDRFPTFDTPTLLEMWRSAPFLHDGSAATMLDVLTGYNKKDRHGVTSHLTQEELAALAEYLLSL